MEQADEILKAYLRVTQHMSQQLRSYFGRLNLTFPQALVLTVLGEEGPVPISTLAERTGSANSTGLGIVDRLEKLGLATVEDLLRYSEYGWRERRIATLLARRYPVALTEADVRKLRRLGQKKLRQA